MNCSSYSKSMLSIGAMAFIAFLGACGDDVTQVTNVGIDSVTAFNDLPPCLDKNEGEPIFVKDSAAIFLCANQTWNNISGKDGINGKNGADGTPCSVLPNLDEKGAYTLACGESSVVIRDGKVGTSCSVSPSTDDSGYLLSCGGEAVIIANGKDGKDGAKGDDGKPCTVQNNKDGSYKLTCGESSITVANGKNATPCVVSPKDNEKGAYTLSCGTSSVDIFDGKNGDNGVAGTKCHVEEFDNGYNLICDDQIAAVITNGQKGDKGDGCSIDSRSVNDDSVYVIKCGTMDSILISKNQLKGTSCSAYQDPTSKDVVISCGGEVVGTLSKGSDGESCDIVPASSGSGFDYDVMCGDVIKGHLKNGENGLSAYRIAVAAGFEGDSIAWIASLKGETGYNCWIVEGTGNEAGSFKVVCGDPNDPSKQTSHNLRDGSNGNPGASCDLVSPSTTVGFDYDVKCGDVIKGSLKNGEQGPQGDGCSITNNEDGSLKITCGKGDNAASKTLYGCSVTDNGNGQLSMVCGDPTAPTTATVFKAMCGSTPYDPDSALCDTRDNTIYKTVKIGNQTWLAENLSYNTVSSYCYDNDPDNCKTYGRLYTWDVAMEVCPDGWYLPTLEDFQILIMTADPTLTGDVWDDSFYETNKASATLKAPTSESGGVAEDNTNFNGLTGAGYMINIGNFYQGGEMTRFWSSTKFNSTNAYRMLLNKTNNVAQIVYNNTYSAMSVRCIKFKDNKIYSLCGTATYNPATQYCESGSLKPNPTCGTTKYNPTTHFCVNSNIIRKCGDEAFNPSNQFCDYRDNQVYNKVTIGTGNNAQTWMAENLNYKTAEGSSCYNFDNDKCEKYGRLYTWFAACGGEACDQNAEKVQGICPEGWHLPSGGFDKDNGAVLEGDFKTLVENANGGESVEWTTTDYTSGYIYADGKGTALKTSSGWNSYQNVAVGTGDAGFSALPAGYRHTDGTTFYNEGSNAYFWSSTQSDGTNAYRLNLSYSNTRAYLIRANKAYGFSVRCLKD